MAFRIHVTAVRNSTADAVRSAFNDVLGEGFADVPLLENAGWISFRTSVWQVSSSDLIQGLRRLNKPGLQFTTEDGERWYVTMIRPDTEPESMIHQFGNHEDSDLDEEYYLDEKYDDYIDPELAFLEDEPLSPSRPKTPFDRFAAEFAELGAPLPQSLMDEVATLSFTAAIERFRKWHRNSFVEFLKSADVEFNANAVRKVLSWQGLTEVELDSDLGNLPRLLMEIGLGEEWETYIAEAEMPQPDPDDEYDEAQETHEFPDASQFILETERVIGPIETTPVVNGPVKLPIKNLVDVQFFPEACQIKNEIRTLLAVKLPASFEQEEFCKLTQVPKSDRAGVEWVPGGFKIGFDDHLLVNWPHIKELFGLEFCRFIEHLPDHSTLTIAFAAEDEPATRQIYQGEIQDKVWHIEASHPSVPAGVFADALSVAADVDRTTHILRDAAETDAVMEATKKDGYLSGMEVKCEGNEVSCEYDVGFLAKIIFRVRFHDYWNVEPYEDHAAKEYRKAVKTKWEFRRTAARQARTQMAPRIDDPIHRGSAGAYWRSDLDHFQDLDPEISEKFQQGMKSLNFKLLGDLNAKRFREYVLRCYVSPDGFSYADLTASMYGYLCWEFISDFSDGSRLTTTTLAMAFSRPPVKLYCKDFPGLEVEELYKEHLHLTTKFKDGKKATPVPLEATLAGVARLLDDSLTRSDLDEANQVDDDEDDEDSSEQAAWE